MKHKNPTLLTLLEMGCKVEFENGYCLRGDTKNNYICCSNEWGADGLWGLNRNGLKSALNDAIKFGKAEAL